MASEALDARTRISLLHLGNCSDSYLRSPNGNGEHITAGDPTPATRLRIPRCCFMEANKTSCLGVNRPFVFGRTDACVLDHGPALSIFLAYLGSEWFVRMGRIVDPLIALGITCWVAGRDGRQAAWHSIRAFKPQYALLGASVPIGLSVIISVGDYIFDRILWAHGFGASWLPEFRSYFDFPDPWLSLLFFGALFEEIIFRGLLQPRFIQRYGLYRGIFLVAIVWAAFHFFSDSYSGASDIGVVLRLASRVFTCLVLGFVFSWLTLRSGSVLPAAIAHTLFNVFVFSNFGPDFTGKDAVRLVLWAVVAYLLFRYWSVKVEDQPGAVATVVEPEPAT